MTTSMRVEGTLWRDGAKTASSSQIADVSLMHGWVPPTVQALALVLLVCAIGWRSRRWWMLRVPFAAGLGVGLAMWLHWYITAAGLAGEPAPRALWGWIALTRAGRRHCCGRLARRTTLAASYGGTGHIAVPAQQRIGPQRVGRIRPDGVLRVEPTDRGSAARSDRPRHPGRDAEQGGGPF